MNRNSIQLIAAKLLLTIMVSFIISAFFLAALTVTTTTYSGHDQCFNSQCGPIQHLFHDFVMLPALLAKNPMLIIICFIILFTPIAVATTPKSPPPRFTLMND